MAAAGDTVQKSVDELDITCAICHEHYTDPKVLPCCHYYCKQCIHSFALRTGINKPFSCPECRKTTTLPEGGVDSLPTAFFINRMKADMERAHSKVEVKMKAFAGHKTSTLDKLKEGGAKDTLPKPTRCKLHDEPLKYFCLDCSCLICYDCSVRSHRDHNYQSVKKAAPDARKGLIQQLEPLKKARENLKQAVAEIQTTESEVGAQAHSIADSVNQAFDELETIIRNRRQAILEEAEARISVKLERLSVQKQSLFMSSAEVQSVIDHTEQCVEHSADDEVMSMLAEIQLRIYKEMKEHDMEGKSLVPVEEADMGVKVSCAEDMKKICETKANIMCCMDLVTAGKGLKSAEVNKLSEFQVIAKLSNGKPTKRSLVVECSLKRLACNSITACKVKAGSWGKHRVQYTPTKRGRHELTMIVNGQAITFPVSVFISPTQLGKPVQVIPTDQGNPVDVATTSNGEIVVANTKDLVLHHQEVKNLKYSELHSLSTIFMGVAVDSTSNNVYAIVIGKPISVEVVKLNPKFKLMQSRKVCTCKNACYVVGVEVVGDEVMVCDQERNCVKVYTKNLEFVREIGRGSKMKDIRGLSSDEEGNLYVCDFGKNCILVFSNAGDFLRSCDVPYPCDVCVAGEHLYVTTGQDRVYVLLRTTGQPVSSFGQHGRRDGEFKFPFGVYVDKNGFVYVCDKDNHRVQIF